MAFLPNACVVAFIILLQWQRCLTTDDLLDEYVKHVDSVNKESESNDRYSSLEYSEISAHQRYRRRAHNLEVLGSEFRKLQRNKREVGGSEFNQWTNGETLDRQGDVVLRWQPRHQEILFRVEARTRGYVGIGFSPNGGMEGADIVMGWVDDRTSKAYLLVSNFKDI